MIIAISTIIMSLILSLLVGAGLGALMGHYGKCSSGACPLTANPWRGAIYGMVLGFLFHSAQARSESGTPAKSQPQPKNDYSRAQHRGASTTNLAPGPVRKQPAGIHW